MCRNHVRINVDNLWKTKMRIIGKKREHRITFSASADLLKEGALFNDEMHKFPTGRETFVPKGVYRYKTHEDANKHQEECLVSGMARLARRRP